MFQIDHSSQFNSDSQLQEIACILAAGFLRLQSASDPALRSDNVSSETALNAARQGLEQSHETLLSVTRGLRSESPRQGAIDG
jgi:hypothetical protein